MGDVTVIVPCRNGEAYLAQMLESVAAQTLRPTHAVLADDGSSDNSAAIAARAGWTVVKTGGTLESGVGIAGARNAAMQACTSRFVAFLDSDDWWEPDHLADCVSLLEANPPAALCFGRMRRSTQIADEAPPGWVPSRAPFDARAGLLRTNFIPVSAVVARRELVVAAGGFDAALRAAEDYDLWLRMSRFGPFIYRDERSLMYRVHGSQISRHTRLMGEAALRVRSVALGVVREDDLPAGKRDMLEQAAAQGWEESLDVLWCYGHVGPYQSWAHRFREAFGRRPDAGFLRMGPSGRALSLLRRAVGRVP